MKPDKNLLDFRPSVMRSLEDAERLINVGIHPLNIFGDGDGNLAGRKLTREEAHAFKIVLDFLNERAAFIRRQLTEEGVPT